MKRKILLTNMLKGFFLIILTGQLSTGQAFAQLKEATTVVIPTPKSYYDFEEGSGTTVTDGGSAQNNGTLTGSDISFTTGGVVSSNGLDGCVEITSEPYDGTSFVDVPYADFHNGDNYTFVAWVKWNSTGYGNKWAYVFWQDGDGSGNTRHVDMFLHISHEGPASVLHNENGEEVRLEPDDPGINIYDGEWHMVAITLEDGVTSTIYADGENIFEYTSSIPIAKTATTNHLQIGAKPGLNMVGKMDKVGIFDVALSEEQIKALYDAKGAVEPVAPSPKSYYDFEEGSGTTVTDSGSAQNNGTLTGSDITFTTGGVVSSNGLDGCVEITSEPYDGTSFVDVPYADFHNGDNYTFTAWLKFNSTDYGNKYLYVFWQDGDGSGNTRHVDLWCSVISEGPASVLNNENGEEVRLEPDDPGINIYDGEWHMVAITLEDGVTSTIYADGENIFEYTSSIPIAKTATTNHLQIGAGNGLNMVGKMDKVGIYDVALSEEQIKALYNAEAAGPTTSINKYENSLKSSLKQNFPNPFSTETTIGYKLDVAGHVQLQILDITGNIISTIAEGNMQAGSYNTKWNANGAAKGIYFYKITLTSKEGTYLSVKKMIVQ